MAAWISALALGALIALIAACLVVGWEEFPDGLRWASLASNLGFALLAADQAQRAYRFTSDTVEVRYLGSWRRKPLPPRLFVWGLPGGDVEILNADEGGRFSFRIPSGWATSGDLVRRLEDFYRENGRLATDPVV
jgi:hypothetical protein